MPVISKPLNLTPDSSIMNGLRSAFGGDDPNSVMAVGGAAMPSGEGNGILSWLGSKIGGLVNPGAANEAGGSFRPAVTQLGKLAVPSIERVRPVAQTLGEVSPDFTPVGGEGMFNAARPSASPMPDAAAQAYHRILEQGGAPTGTALLDMMKQIRGGK